MADLVPIIPELAFRSQIYELAMYLFRSASDPSISQTFEQACKLQEGQTDLDAERKQSVAKLAVDKVVELKGALDGLKESDVESSHLLLLYVVSSNFQPTSPEHDQLVGQLISAVETGGKEAQQAGKVSRAELAARIVSNIYNSLPTSSSLRPTAILALFRLLALLGDLSSLSLTPVQLTSMLSQWSLSPSDEAALLTSLASAYESTGELSNAVEVLLLALDKGDSAAAERALVLSVADETQFSVDRVVRSGASGQRPQLQGPAKELAALFTETDELQAVGAGLKWVEANEAWIKGFSVSRFQADNIVSKLRLIALATLCARSQARQLSYADVAQTLRIDESEVEFWVIDAISAKLISARLSQPTSTIRITSVSSAGTRRFGTEEWQLLERRLGEWKASVDEARQVIGEAETVAAQGPITHQRRGPRPQGQGQQQHQQGQETEVAA